MLPLSHVSCCKPSRAVLDESSPAAPLARSGMTSQAHGKSIHNETQGARNERDHYRGVYCRRLWAPGCPRTLLLLLVQCWRGRGLLFLLQEAQPERIAAATVAHRALCHTLFNSQRLKRPITTHSALATICQAGASATTGQHTPTPLRHWNWSRPFGFVSSQASPGSLPSVQLRNKNPYGMNTVLYIFFAMIQHLEPMDRMAVIMSYEIDSYGLF